MELSRQVRANNPSPVAWTELDGERFRVLRALPAGADLGLAPGAVEVDSGPSWSVPAPVRSSWCRCNRPGSVRSAAADWGRGLRAPAVFA